MLKKFFFLIPLFLFALTGCSEESIGTDPGAATDDQALQELATEDSSAQSFEENYDDAGTHFFLNTAVQGNIYPIKIGRRINSVSRQFSRQITGDSAYVTMTSTYTGVFIIEASYEPVTPGDTTVTADTVIQKPFTSVIVRNMVFVRINSSNNPRLNWKLVKISLPAGGTSSDNIIINKAVLTFANGDSLVITNPNEFFLSRNPSGVMRGIPVVLRNTVVRLRVEIYSAYADDDFVTLTHSANLRGFFRVKRRLELISSEVSGSGYAKVYEHSFLAGNAQGHFHAVIDATPRGVLFDSAAQFETKVWGIPYFVR